MPIEDADRVHSKHGVKEESTITIFKWKIGIMKLLFIVGGGIAAIFILIAAVMMLMPPQIIDPTNISPVQPHVIDTPGINFEIITTSYNYRIIKMSYINNKTIDDIQKELLISMYPPDSPYYVQRQSIQYDSNIKRFNNQYNTIYIYTGTDNAFHMSYSEPIYQECVDFIDGDWEIHVDKKSKNIYTYKFNIINSKTFIVENGNIINILLQSGSGGSTYFIYSGIYKERLSITKPTRLLGVNNPIIDAGGVGPDITLHSNNNVITGLTLTNSGNKESYDGGIVIGSESTGNLISKNTIYKTIYGIWMYKSSENTITNNTIRDNDKIGIMLLESRSNIITSNNIYNNIDGIHLDSKSALNTIRENNVHDNKVYGVIIDDYKLINNICEYNTYVNNKMSCSDSADRTTVPTQVGTSSQSPTPTTTDDWSSCENNPKCYQS